jgi:hypothetical protein
VSILLSALLIAAPPVDDQACNLRGFGWCLTVPPEAEVSVLDDCVIRSVRIRAADGREVALRQGDEVFYEVRPGPDERLGQWRNTPILDASTPDLVSYRIPVRMQRLAEDPWVDSQAFRYWTVTWPRDGWLGYPGIEAIGSSLQLCRAGECNGEDLPARTNDLGQDEQRC